MTLDTIFKEIKDRTDAKNEIRDCQRTVHSADAWHTLEDTTDRLEKQVSALWDFALALDGEEAFEKYRDFCTSQ